MAFPHRFPRNICGRKTSVPPASVSSLATDGRSSAHKIAYRLPGNIVPHRQVEDPPIHRPRPLVLRRGRRLSEKDQRFRGSGRRSPDRGHAAIDRGGSNLWRDWLRDGEMGYETARWATRRRDGWLPRTLHGVEWHCPDPGWGQCEASGQPWETGVSWRRALAIAGGRDYPGIPVCGVQAWCARGTRDRRDDSPCGCFSTLAGRPVAWIETFTTGRAVLLPRSREAWFTIPLIERLLPC